MAPPVPPRFSLQSLSFTTLVLLLCACWGLGVSMQLALLQSQGVAVVTDLLYKRPSGVEVRVLGKRHAAFDRPQPKGIDPRYLRDLVDVKLNGIHNPINVHHSLGADAQARNTFTDGVTPFVASIPNGFVTGDEGIVWDRDKNVYLERNFVVENKAALPPPIPQQVTSGWYASRAATVHFPVLATTIQKHGHMYYHFLAEMLAKFLLLKRAGLPEGAKVLTWGSKHETKFFNFLGIPTENLVVYDPRQVYSADLLLFPTPVKIFTPSRESLGDIREGFLTARGGEGGDLPENERDLVVYCSRAGQNGRRVANEEALLAAVRAAHPGEKVVVYHGLDDVGELVDLFRRAKVVMGPHGAGLAHSIFSAPGTKVVEFMFSGMPIMPFWHVATSMLQDYWMITVPFAGWSDEQLDVPIDEVLDVLEAVLAKEKPLSDACPPGTFGDDASAGCKPCPPGTYAFNAGQTECKPCAPGRYAASSGSTACRTCPSATYSSGGTACAVCPLHTLTFINGASRQDQCVDVGRAKADHIKRMCSASYKLSRTLEPLDDEGGDVWMNDEERSRACKDAFGFKFWYWNELNETDEETTNDFMKWRPELLAEQKHTGL